MAQFRDEDLPGAPEYWAVLERQVALGELTAVDHLFKLMGIGLSGSGLDDCGFGLFELQTGWDRDHGLGVLVHRDRVLAAGGMTELIEGPGVLEGVRAVQSYDLDEGDEARRGRRPTPGMGIDRRTRCCARPTPPRRARLLHVRGGPL